MEHSLLGWLLAPVGFTQAKSTSAEALRLQQSFFSKLGTGFLPGLVGAIFGAGMMWGSQQGALLAIREANAVEHAAMAAAQHVQDERMNRIQADAAVAAANASAAARDAAELRGRLEAVERLLAVQLQQRMK